MSWFTKEIVLVPIDFSPESLDALRQAREMVEHPQALHVVHVLHQVHYSEPNQTSAVLDEGRRIEVALSRLKERLEGDLKGARPQVCVGSPGPAIAQLAKQLKAELVVMPTHGRTGLARLGLGSVAEQVVRLSPCPVLVLRS